MTLTAYGTISSLPVAIAERNLPEKVGMAISTTWFPRDEVAEMPSAIERLHAADATATRNWIRIGLNI
jgi:hypothetical protein